MLLLGVIFFCPLFAIYWPFTSELYRRKGRGLVHENLDVQQGHAAHSL
jgi:hypothetical protein